MPLLSGKVIKFNQIKEAINIKAQGQHDKMNFELSPKPAKEDNVFFMKLLSEKKKFCLNKLKKHMTSKHKIGNRGF